MVYYIISDNGTGWDFDDDCPNSGRCLGHTTELEHAKVIARLEDQKLRDAREPGEVIVYTLDQYGAYQQVEWKAAPMPKVAAASA